MDAYGAERTGRSAPQSKSDGTTSQSDSDKKNGEPEA
jgi:hypothetical protein